MQIILLNPNYTDIANHVMWPVCQSPIDCRGPSKVMKQSQQFQYPVSIRAVTGLVPQRSVISQQPVSDQSQTIYSCDLVVTSLRFIGELVTSCWHITDRSLIQGDDQSQIIFKHVTIACSFQCLLKALSMHHPVRFSNSSNCDLLMMQGFNQYWLHLWRLSRQCSIITTTTAFALTHWMLTSCNTAAAMLMTCTKVNWF